MANVPAPVAHLGEFRLPITASLAQKLQVDESLWRVLTDQIFPSAKSVDAISMALSYCRARKLDILKRPVHIVPMWSNTRGTMVETVWPGISEIRTTAARTGEYAGNDPIEFGPTIERTFEGKIERWENKQKVLADVKKVISFPEWASITVYRMVQGVRCPFHTKIFWIETCATLKGGVIPNDMWEKRPFGQIDKCVEAAGLRRAFPEEVGNMLAAEEMEGRVIDNEPAPAAPIAPKPPKKDAAPTPPKATEKPVDNAKKSSEVVDQQTGEVGSREMQEALEKDGDKLRQMTGEDHGPFNPFEDKVEDAVTEPVFDAAKAIDALESDLASAMDETTIEEVFDHHDLLAKLDGTPAATIDMAIVNRLKSRALERVAKAKK